MRRSRSIVVLGTLVGAAALWAAGPVVHAFQTQSAFSGVWQLNVKASTNPNGPQSAQPPKAGGSGDAGASGDAGGGATGRKSNTGPSSGPPPGGSLGPEERTRLYAELRVLQAAPKKLGIEANDKQFDLTYEDGPPTGALFKHVPDGKKRPLQTKLGKLDQKVSWTGKTFKRETSTAEALNVTEEYALSGDGKQLTVTISVKSTMERIAPALAPPITRVYDRAQ